MLVAAVHGFVLAIALILPIGMQNGFIISQGAVHKRVAGALPAVITAAVCDTALIGLAVVGISAAVLHVAWLRYVFGLIGIGFLLYMGWTTWQDSSTEQDNDTADVWPAQRQIKFAVSVSILNPHAIMDTLAVIGGSALVYTSWGDKLAFGAACAAVSWIWFIVLLLTGHMMGRAILKNASLSLINKISAIMMWGSSIYLAYVIYTFN